MTKYATKFLPGLADKQRGEFRQLIQARKAYLEQNGDGSEVLIILNSGCNDEDIFARPLDSQTAVCIGKRTKRGGGAAKTGRFSLLIAAFLRIGRTKRP
jgi:hypothetical protein